MTSPVENAIAIAGQLDRVRELLRESADLLEKTRDWDDETGEQT